MAIEFFYTAAQCQLLKFSKTSWPSFLVLTPFEQNYVELIKINTYWISAVLLITELMSLIRIIRLMLLLVFVDFEIGHLDVSGSKRLF